MPRATQKTYRGSPQELGRPNDVDIVSYDPDTLEVVLEFVQPSLSANDLLIDAREMLARVAKDALSDCPLPVSRDRAFAMDRLVADIDFHLTEDE